jgi:hypothetical protein
MNTTRRVIIWIAVALALGGTAAALVLIYVARRAPITLKGAVIALNSDVDRQQPLTDVNIRVIDGFPASDCKTDSSGFFRITLPKWIMQGHRVMLQFRHPGYHPLDLPAAAGDELYVVRMMPDRPERLVQTHRPLISISNITIRYTVKATTSLNVGSQVRTFQVVNTGNVPCNGRDPCSPDGKWKAAIGSAILDAGEGDVFHNVRVSCIAGPCPFTKIESNGFSQGGRRITVSATDWSDTATFLVEADVFHPMASDDVRIAYPVVFGETLSFTVPPSAEGVSIEADVNGDAIVFPLGPDLLLPWASCVTPVNQAQTRIYRCELKPGYRFK